MISIFFFFFSNYHSDLSVQVWRGPNREREREKWPGRHIWKQITVLRDMTSYFPTAFYH